LYIGYVSEVLLSRLGVRVVSFACQVAARR
jgi:hypothetical protein